MGYVVFWVMVSWKKEFKKLVLEMINKEFNGWLFLFVIELKILKGINYKLNMFYEIIVLI